MYKVVSNFKAPYVLMHLRGIPKNMMEKTNYENLTVELLKYFSKKIKIQMLQTYNALAFRKI